MRREGEQKGGGGKRRGGGGTKSIFSLAQMSGGFVGERGRGGADTLCLPLRVGQLPFAGPQGRGVVGGA